MLLPKPTADDIKRHKQKEDKRGLYYSRSIQEAKRDLNAKWYKDNLAELERRARLSYGVDKDVFLDLLDLLNQFTLGG